MPPVYRVDAGIAHFKVGTFPNSPFLPRRLWYSTWGDGFHPALRTRRRSRANSTVPEPAEQAWNGRGTVTVSLFHENRDADGHPDDFSGTAQVGRGR